MSQSLPGQVDDPRDTDSRPIAVSVEHGDGVQVDIAAAQADALASLLAVLDLQAAPADGADVFVGQSQPQPWGRVFGGQVLAQSIAAAQRTVDADRPIHSMHGYFLRAGDPKFPITFAVERLRDGRSFSARRTHALQHGRPILSMIASFQEPADGLDHAEPMPEVPGPETLPTLAQRYAGVNSGSGRYWFRQRPMDLRHVEDPVYLEAGGEASNAQHVWMKAVGDLPDDPALHAAVLAYASDYGMLEPVLRRHGRAWASPGLRAASLDHAMWFHRPARADEWLLNVQTSPSAQGARGLGVATIYTAGGALVATVAQEGMIRFPAPQNRT